MSKYKTVYIEFDIKNENYKEYESILENFLQDLNSGECLSDINSDINVHEIEQGDMTIQL